MIKMKTPRIKSPEKMRVSEGNIRKAAMRVLSQKLVSPEIHYIQRTLGATATQQQMDDTIVAVRKLPWTSIVLPD